MKISKLLALFLGLLMSNLYALTINIVAAENFYGQLAKEIGGNLVKVTSIISNPNADPHLFTTSPSVNKALIQAQIIIYNGDDYDSWINQMLTTLDKNKVTVINVADLVGIKSGQNPHLWYKPETFPILAKLLAAQINKLNPAATRTVNANLQAFISDHDKILQMIAHVKLKYNSTPVTATEPVFTYMTDAFGFDMKGLDFQWKIMNDAEPTPRMIATYQSLLIDKKVKLLFYNNQITNLITQNMKSLAQQNHIPIVGITETLPENTTINQWLATEIKATLAGLN